MRPSWLVLSHALGIVWADAGGELPANLVFVWLAAAAAFTAYLTAASQAEFEQPRMASSRICRWLSVLTLLGVLFLGGYEALTSRFASAEGDRARAQAVDPNSLRLAEARVRVRHRGAFGDRIEFEQVRAIDGGRPLPERLLLRLNVHSDFANPLLETRGERLLWPGVWVRVGIRVSPLRGTRNPGTPDREHREARRGLAAVARLAKPDWVMGIAHHGFFGEGSRVPLGASRAATRKQVASRLAAAGLSAGLVRALAMGDRSGLSRETRQAFRRLGLAHLIAISGLHIGFIAGLAGWLGLLAVLRLCPPARTIRVFEVSLVFASCAAAFYAWWTDAGVSVERAALLFGLYAVLRLVWRRIPASSALAWVALGLLMHDPAALFDVGAQLSFTACAALMAGGVWRNDSPSLTPMGETRWRVTVQGIRSLCRTSLVVSIATAPLLIQHGFALSPLSPFVNILAIPFTGFVALPCSLLVAGLSGIDAVPDSWLRALSLPASAMEEAAIGLAVRIPQWPAGEGLGWPLLVLLLGLAFAALRQGRWGPTMVIWLVVSGAGASPVLFESPMASLPRVIFFDVGQGDAALIQGREAVILVDTGPGPATGEGGATLLRGLRAAKVRRIDLLVLTHGDLDHRAGLIRVLESIEVVELWLPGTGSSDPVLRKAAGEARARGTRVSWQVAADRRDAQPVRRGDLELEVLWPLATGSMFKTSRNAESLVLRVGVDERSFLFTADIGEPVEDALLQRGSRVDADVLKVGHHGSGGSSSRAFLARVSPELAILSAPCTASRGLPNGQAIERIRRSGAKIWWTGRDGAVIVAPLSRGRFSVQGSGRVRDCSPR